MTRQAKYDYEALRREYVYDPSPRGISLRGLADKHGMNLSSVTDHALPEGWYEQRQKLRRAVGEKTFETQADNWAKMNSAVREKTTAVALKYLDMYATALDAGDIKVSTRDMLGVAAMLRVFLADAAATAPGEEALIDPDNASFTPEAARALLDRMDQLGSGLNGRAADAGEPAPTGVEDAGPD